MHAAFADLVRECPRRTEEEKKKYEAHLSLYGHMEGELLYMFDGLFANWLKHPSLAPKVTSDPSIPANTGPPTVGDPVGNSE